MPDQPRLKASIKIRGALKVGSNPQPPNEFDLLITNMGGPVESTTRKPPHLYLEGRLGSGNKALFLDESDARQCDKSVPKGWNVDWDFSCKEEGIFRFDIYTFNKTLFKEGEVLKISFSNVISKTDPEGAAALSFVTDFSDSKQDLSIAKKAVKADIISFYSDPPDGVQNLPGDNVTLKWRINKLTNLELTQVGITDPLLCDFSNDEGSKTIKCDSVDMSFSLKGYNDRNRLIEQHLSVKVVQKGWYDTRNTVLEGDPGYPSPQTEDEASALEDFDLEPTLLLNANNTSLYGIFRHQYQGKERAFLFQTENPIGGWSLVESSVPNQKGSIPDGFSTSPGVYCQDKIWLIGGSQIDQEKTSSSVWCFDPSRNTWSELKGFEGSELPIPRMGHAVLEFQNEIWVMGGRDGNGNALKDVWTLDVTAKKWTPLNQASWTARCLINPVVFKKQIWLYGGAKAPSSATLFDDLYTGSYTNEQGAKWEKQDLTGVIEGSDSRKPIASCLQVFGGKLHLFGKFRTAAEDGSRLDEPMGFRLTDLSTGTWERFPSGGLATWGTHTTFSYQAVNYKDRMLIAKALPASSRKDPNPILKIYIPG